MSNQQNKLTKFKAADLMAIHNEKCNEGYGWLPMLRAKETYSANRSVLMRFCESYGVPTRQLDTRGQLLMSQPAFDYVLTMATELQGTHLEDNAIARLDSIRNQEEQVVRAKIRAEFEEKLANA